MRVYAGDATDVTEFIDLRINEKNGVSLVFVRKSNLKSFVNVSWLHMSWL